MYLTNVLREARKTVKLMFKINQNNLFILEASKGQHTKAELMLYITAEIIPIKIAKSQYNELIIKNLFNTVTNMACQLFN